jgi:Dynamin GTPase effector domain
MVPKAITLTLVNHSKENLQRELLQELYKPDVLEDLLKESELVVARRKEVVGMVSALNKAEECVFPFMPVWISHQLLHSLQDCGGCLSKGGLPIRLWSMFSVLFT